MNRRTLLATLGASPILLALSAMAQPTDRVRRVAVLVLGFEGALGQSLVTTFREQLEHLG